MSPLPLVCVLQVANQVSLAQAGTVGEQWQIVAGGTEGSPSSLLP